RFGTGGSHQDPTAIVEQKLQAIHSVLLDDTPAVKFMNIRCDLLLDSSADRRIELHIQAAIIYFSDFRKKILQLIFQRFTPARHHFRDQQTCQDPILLRNVTANGKSGALLAAQDDASLFYIFADEFEANGRLEHFTLVKSGNAIDEMRCRDGGG